MSNLYEQETALLPDLDLIARARAGDQAAFRALVERYEGLVGATVTGMLGPGPDAEDVGQETFVRFYRALGQFRGESKLATYLTRIAMNLSLNALKRRRRWYWRFLSLDGLIPGLPEAPFEQAQEGSAQEEAELVRAAVQALEPKFRAVVVLRLIDGYSTRETAELLGIPVGTVLSRLARAQQKLKERLEPTLRHYEK